MRIVKELLWQNVNFSFQHWKINEVQIWWNEHSDIWWYAIELENFYRLTKDLQVKHIIKVGLKLKYVWI